MKNVALSIAALLLLCSFNFFGCSSSDESTDNGDKKTPPAVVQNQAPPPVTKDTVKTQSSAPATTPASTPPQTQPQTTQPAPDASLPTGKYSVQVGAYSMQDKADQIAQTARTRFISNKVYEWHDASTGLTKILIGDFMMKDDARAFRDQIIQQYADDYKGAWVFDVPGH